MRNLLISLIRNVSDCVCQSECCRSQDYVWVIHHAYWHQIILPSLESGVYYQVYQEVIQSSGKSMRWLYLGFIATKCATIIASIRSHNSQLITARVRVQARSGFRHITL
jgi:hypothetical protein